jgi:DNA processing protein
LKADDRFIAIVGTRVPSLYGEKSAYNISERIALYGGVIVSGLAFGIDAICHYAAVRNGKPTVAVLASPADKVTPSSHFNLSENILKTGGTIISEYAGDVTANKYRFLERNRLISGLCRATVIIEAAKKSGALITAAHASNQNRDVYALVGDITRPQAQGCLNLIEKNIACPVVSVDSLLRDLGFDPQKNKYAALTGPELKIIEFLKKSPLPADELCAKTKLKPQILNVMLTKLEIKNLIGKNEKMNWEIV